MVVNKKSTAAVALGRKGGKVKHPNKGMGGATPEERKARALKMVAARRAKATAAAPTHEPQPPKP